MKNFIMLFAFMGLLACQNNRQQRINFADFITQNELVSLNSVQQFRFQGWQPLDDRYLILRSNQRMSYLIKLMSGCHELPYTHQIKLKQAMNTRLQSKFDSIQVAGNFPQTCRIDSIYSLDQIQQKTILDFSNQPEQLRD